MTSRVVDVRALLTEHVDRLRLQHRSGITPSYGQVEDLFDLSDRLKREIESAPATITCTVPACGQPGDTPVAAIPYCARHARAVLEVTAAIQSLTPALAQVHVATAAAGRTSWPVARDAQPGGDR